MSDESQFISAPPSRPLREEERALIISLLSACSAAGTLDEELVNARVRDMQDGGMGSIRFVRAEPGRFGSKLTEAQYMDSDGVLVSINLNADTEAKLFELDFWKVDFSPLKKYPKPSDVVFNAPATS